MALTIFGCVGGTTYSLPRAFEAWAQTGLYINLRQQGFQRICSQLSPRRAEDE